MFQTFITEFFHITVENYPNLYYGRAHIELLHNAGSK